jgi:hypothetical protein
LNELSVRIDAAARVAVERERAEAVAARQAEADAEARHVQFLQQQELWLQRLEEEQDATTVR